jgi:hypothetical protein
VGGINAEMVAAASVSVLVAAPVVWHFISRHFKLKEKEVELEAQTRRDWVALQGKTLDARLTALETAVATLGGAVRQQLPQSAREALEAPHDPQNARDALEAPHDSQSDPGRREPTR